MVEEDLLAAVAASQPEALLPVRPQTTRRPRTQALAIPPLARVPERPPGIGRVGVLALWVEVQPERLLNPWEARQ